MTDIPVEMQKRRAEIAAEFLFGNGIEIGALDSPLPLPAKTNVVYVDRLNEAALRAQYPELSEKPLVMIDVVDDGERLGVFPNKSVDFIIANHFMEHTQNPIGTLRSHLSKLKRGGRLYYAIPDKGMSFDKDRPLTPFSHLIEDDKDGGAASRRQHFVEWATYVDGLTDPNDIERNAEANMRRDYSIHFHVWNESTWRDFLRDAKAHTGDYKTLYFGRNDTEVIAVLERT